MTRYAPPALALAALLLAACDLDEVDIKDQSGNAVQVEGKGAKKVITTPDGAQYTVKPGGITDAEGNKIKRDGTIIQADGTRVNVYGDGTKATMKVDEVELGADGSKTLVHADGSKTVIKADGSIERQFKDGTKARLESSAPEAPTEAAPAPAAP